jgi:2-polyprenyl-6-methoxyphenol hydroxylase-like FAD-dependent oxidoreductase
VGRIVVCGAGVIGLSAAMMLARDGHDVTVLEADPAPPPAAPADAWDDWQREGIAQFRQPHNLLPGARQVLDAELPELTAALVAAGCRWIDLLSVQPPGVTDRGDQPGDDRFRVPSGRRPVVEAVFAQAAEATTGVTVRRGVRVQGPLTGASAITGLPHVVGVRTDDGEELTADLVVDAAGRRSALPEWLAQLGTAPPVVESQHCGFLYYTRNYRGQLPQRLGPIAAPLGSLSMLTLPADNDTWSVTMAVASVDRPLKELRHVDVFERVVRAHPLQAHWADGEPLTDVLPMAGLLDRYHRFAAHGRPLATGVVAVGDAWASTNPSAGRGISVGLLHAQLLRDAVRAHLDDPGALAVAWDEMTEEKVTPHYRNQLRSDRARIAEMDAIRHGDPAPQLDEATKRFLVASGRDAVVFRAMLETVSCLALPHEVMARPGMAERVEELGDGEPGRLPGPDRGRLLELLAG